MSFGKDVIGTLNGRACILNVFVGVPTVMSTGGTDSPAAPACFIGFLLWFIIKMLLGDDEGEEELKRQGEAHAKKQKK